MGAALLMSCGNSSEKMKRLAKENLELSVDYPKQLRVLAVSEPDSAFGAGYFTKDEVKGMFKNDAGGHGHHHEADRQHEPLQSCRPLCRQPCGASDAKHGRNPLAHHEG